MRVVYVVARGYRYEGEEVAGVYTTARKAFAAGVGGDYQNVYRVGLDGGNVEHVPEPKRLKAKKAPRKAARG